MNPTELSHVSRLSSFFQALEELQPLFQIQLLPQIEPSRMLRGSNGNNIWNFGNISGLGICRGYRE